MRVIALDIGEKRIGVASGDTDTRIAVPVKVLPTDEVVNNARTWRMLLEDYEPELIVSGLPRSLKGDTGPQAKRVRGVAEAIAGTAKIPLEFADERLSSSQAKRMMREDGMSERDMRGKIDMIAASLFLQMWLDSHAEDGK